MFSSNIYNNKGQLIEASTPWKQGETPLKTVFSYDDFGRKIQESSDAGTVSYSYSGKTIQVSGSGGQSSSKTMDSQGNVISSTDNGGTISYTYKSIGKPGSTSNNGSTWTMAYDAYGRQTSLTDPNAGTIAYRYNKFGEMTRQLDAKGNIDSLTYDVLGRVATEYRNNNEGTKVFRYDPAGKPGLIDSITYPGGSEKYIYDSKSRLINQIIKINNANYSTKYGYDNYSRLDTLTYPSTFAIRYVYNNFGYLHIVQKKSDGVMIWDATSMNSFNQYTQYYSGNSLTTTKTYDCLGMLRGIDTRYQTSIVQNLSYSFDEETGNLISRRDNRRNLTEIFSYDNLGRLREVSGPSPLSMDFANNGNITSKTSVGDYSYNATPHAVTGVTNPDGLISSNDQRITYTTFNKVDSIIQSNYKYDLQYGYQDQRTVSKLMNGAGVVQKTVYYAGPYEKEVFGSTTKEFHYIYGGDGLAAILKRQSGTDTMYYVHKDHLGSFDKVTNSAGTVVDSMSFDAWGRRRNPANWTYSNIPATKFSRGYTGHEHLDQFDLINMNGRIYDPLLGRFLNPDPLLTDPYFTQGFNRYSYVLNNPLKYTDPSGYYKRLEDPPLDVSTRPHGDGGGVNNLSPLRPTGVSTYNPGTFITNYGNAYLNAVINGYTGKIEDLVSQINEAPIETEGNGTVYVTEIIDYINAATYDGGKTWSYEIVKTITKTTAISLDNASGQGGELNYNPNVDFGLTAIGTEADIFGTAATLTTVQLAKTVKGVSTVSKVATGAGIIGLATTGSVATYEYVTGQANTHTLFDVGLTVVLTGVSVAGVIVASPAIIVGSAVGGLVWGITSFSGGSDAIDSWTNNWGQRTIYGLPGGAGGNW